MHIIVDGNFMLYYFCVFRYKDFLLIVFLFSADNKNVHQKINIHTNQHGIGKINEIDVFTRSKNEDLTYNFNIISAS